MSTPIVYQSTDVGAPVFIPNDQSTWLALIKQCLVYGYTGKAAAGWNLAYEDTVAHTLVLQQGSGNGRYLWLGSPGVAAGYGYDANRYVIAQSYIYMTGINTGTGQWPGAANVNAWNFASSYNYNQSTPQDWILVATSKFFLIYIFATQAWSPPQGIPRPCFFFGDFKSNLSGDQYNTILNGYNTSNGAGGSTPTTGVAGDLFPFAWNWNTTAPNTMLWLAGPYYQQLGIPTSARLMPENFATSGSYAGNGLEFFPDFVTNELHIGQLQVQEFWNGTCSFRGKLPGIFVPSFSPEHANGTIINGEGSLAGHSFLVVSNQQHYANTPVLYIQLDNWND